MVKFNDNFELKYAVFDGIAAAAENLYLAVIEATSSAYQLIASMHKGGFISERRRYGILASPDEIYQSVLGHSIMSTSAQVNFRNSFAKQNYTAAMDVLLNYISSFKSQEYYDSMVTSLVLKMDGGLGTGLSKVFEELPRTIAIDDLIGSLEDRIRDVMSSAVAADRIIEEEKLKREAFHQSTIDRQARNNLADAINVDKAVPAQQDIAPVYFEIKDGRIIPRAEISSLDPQDQNNVSEIRSALTDDADRLIAELQAANNINPRVMAAMQRLRQSLDSETNIIRVAFFNTGAARMIRASADEMDDVLVADLLTFSDQVDQLGAQFPDYQRFVTQAQLTRLEPSQIADVFQRLPSLASDLREVSEIVDPGVPEAIAELHIQTNRISPDDKRAGFAVIKTIANLANRLWKLSLEHLSEEATAELRGRLGRAAKTVGKHAGDVAGDVVKNVKKDASNLATAAIYGILITAIGAILNITGAVENLGWVVAVAEYLRRKQTDIMK